jgi:hypothetical protein
MTDESSVSFSHTIATNSSAWVIAKDGEMFYTSRDDGKPSERLIRAIARGEVTEGGLAEAGWFVLGTITEDGIK